MLKVAVTLLFASIVTVQLEEVPVHAPDHPAKVDPELALAVSVTLVPELKVVPVGLLVTVPLPVPDLLIVNVYWEEVAPD